MGGRKEDYPEGITKGCSAGSLPVGQIRYLPFEPMFTQSKLDLSEIRKHLIEQSDFREYPPEYFITVSYHDPYSRQDLVKFHKRISAVIHDTFDPYNLNPICEAYFIEEGKKKLKTVNHRLVKNSILDKYELDNEVELVKGNLHTHLLLSLPSVPIETPNKQLRKVWSKCYFEFGGRPPMHLLSEENHQELIAETIEYVIRDRCPYFIGNSEDYVDVQLINQGREFGTKGQKGWQGALHYATKQMYSKDQFLEVFDEQNSNICVA